MTNNDIYRSDHFIVSSVNLWKILCGVYNTGGIAYGVWYLIISNDFLSHSHTKKICKHHKRGAERQSHIFHKSEMSSLKPSTVAVQPSLCRIWSETLTTGFKVTLFLKKALFSRVLERFLQ